MKRFALALPIAAAWVLYCLPAWAQELAAQTAKILPEPDVLKVPWWMPLVGVLIAAFRTFFSDSTRELPTIAAKWRTSLVALLAFVGTFIEQIVGGVDMRTAALTFVMLGVPSIVQEILKALFSGPKNAGGGGGSASSDDASGPKTSMRPPPAYSTKLEGDWGGAVAMSTVRALRCKVIRTPAAVGVAIGLCVLALPGCATLKEVPKTVRDVSTEVLADVQEAKQIVDALHAIATTFFLLHANPETQAKVEHLFGTVSLALNTAIRASHGARHAAGEEYDLAFASFRAAYADLTAMLKNLGIIAPDGGKMGAVRSAGGQLEVPEPRAARARAGS